MLNYSFWLCFFFFSLSALAENTYRKTVLSSIREEVEKSFNVKWSFDSGGVDKLKARPVREKLSVGQAKVEKMKAKVRANLAKQRKEQASTLRRRGSWGNQRSSELEVWGKGKQSLQSDWERERKELIHRWFLARKRFLKDLPLYKKAMVDFDEFELGVKTLKGEPAKKLIPFDRESLLKGKEQIVLIPQTFRSPTRNQGTRATCASFAGIKAMEIKILQKRKEEVDLSEQYFYWASKPRCQNSPCSKKGSWVRAGFLRSQSSASLDIPLEKDCPYSPNVDSKNVTYTPLGSRCFKGAYKVGRFRNVKNLGDIKMALRDGHPVVGGFRLTEDFFKNKGFVFYNPSIVLGEGVHSKGHALLIVGYIELPSSLKREQGAHCYLVLNSWGEGWGKGGYSCLGEKWIRKYRYQMSFLALEEMI